MAAGLRKDFQMNATWHRSHRLPKGSAAKTRLQWHLEHDVHCGCRPMPARMKRQLLRQLSAERPKKEE